MPRAAAWSREMQICKDSSVAAKATARGVTTEEVGKKKTKLIFSLCSWKDFMEGEGGGVGCIITLDEKEMMYVCIRVCEAHGPPVPSLARIKS